MCSRTLGVITPIAMTSPVWSDRDGSGEIDRAEFEMAFYAVDPVSGNTIGFQPNKFLHPRDAFEVGGNEKKKQNDSVGLGTID